MSAIVRLYDGIVIGLAVITGVMIAAMPLLIAYDVITRNLGFHPPIWAVPVNEYVLLYATVLVAPWLVRRKGHVFVEAFIASLKGRARRVLAVAVYCVCSGLSLVIAYYTLRMTIGAADSGETDVRSFPMPVWLLYGPMSLAFLLTATEFLRFVIRGESYYDTNVAERTSA